MERRVFKWTAGFFLATFGCLAASVPGWAQIERAELGKRLQRFELIWAQSPTEAQVATAPPMQEAVSSFFSLRLLRAAEKLDQAWWTAQAIQPTDEQRFVIAHRTAIKSLILDTARDTIPVRLESFYPITATIEAAEVEFSIASAQNALPIQRPATVERLGPPTRCTWKEAVAGVELDVKALPEGDYEIRTSVRIGDQSLDLLPTGWSRIRDAKVRVEQLRQPREQRETEESPWIRATIQDQFRILNSMLEGEAQEVDYPAHHWLVMNEQMLARPETAATLIRDTAPSRDVWLTVAQGRKKVPLRLRVPANFDPAAPLGVLMLFHGAGGSENMFFETYGAGGAVAAGLQRGWLVVATRQGLTGMSLDARQILEALQPIFAIDHDQVYFMGHSMGAGQVATQVGLHPTLPRAVAAIGGGGRPRQIEAAAGLPWFIAAGSLDFGKSGAKSLSQSLQRAGGKQIVYREYPNVEHMVIVQAALPDAFEFLDQAKKAKP
jgi:pimeloyl-ACP methyl ester carboxylesterase